MKRLSIANKKEINSFNLKNDFEILTNNENQTTKLLFKELINIKIKSNNISTNILYKEWKRMFQLSETDNSKLSDIKSRRAVLTKLTGFHIDNEDKEYQTLYSLNTTFALTIKLLAVKILNHFEIDNHTYTFEDLLDFNNQYIKIFLKDMEKGTLFEKVGIINLIEEDCFSWYLFENLDNNFYDLIKKLISELNEYENVTQKSFTQDLFKDLYENCIPKEIRHSFGEYYTPYWLADNVINQSIDMLENKIDYRAIDTCCGSGTFVMGVLKKIIEEQDYRMIVKEEIVSKNERIKEICNRVKGIDINPIAVLSARVNYFYNIYYMLDESSEIEIPIYLGDAAYQPEMVEINNIKYINYDFLTEDKIYQINVPYDLVSNNNFIRIMKDVKNMITNKENLTMTLLSQMEYHNEEIKNKIKDFVDTCITLFNINHLYIIVLSNYLKTATIGEFDLIVGNPPWVDWKVLPDSYRDKIRTTSKIDTLFSKDKNVGGINLNLCALISNKVSEKWLKEDGVLTFLMPKSLLFNRSHEGFRNFIVNKNGKERKMHLHQIDDWENAGYPFDSVKIPFCTYIYKFKENKNPKGVMGYNYIKKKDVLLNNQEREFENVKEHFDIKPFYAVNLSTANNNYTFIYEKEILDKLNKIIGTSDYQFRKGFGTTPIWVYRVKFLENINEKLAKFQLFEKRGNRIYESDKSVILEKELIKPLIISPYLQPFTNSYDNLYLVFPYYENSKKPIPFEELKIITPNIANYLLENKNNIENQSEYNKRIQSSNEFYGVIRVGKYSYADNFVAIRDNTKLVSSYFGKMQTHWGELKSPVFDSHVAYISQIDNHNISEEEAFYLVGILNTPIIKFFVENSSDSRSFGTKFGIKLPKFDSTNKLHVNISNLSKLIYNSDILNKDLLNKLEEIYLEL